MPWGVSVGWCSRRGPAGCPGWPMIVTPATPSRDSGAAAQMGLRLVCVWWVPSDGFGEWLPWISGVCLVPSASDPRVVVRLSPSDFAVIEAAAEAAGVATGGLVRECAVRYAGQVAREVTEGRLKLRARSGSGASSEVEESEPAPSAEFERVLVTDVGVRRAIAFRRATGRL